MSAPWWGGRSAGKSKAFTTRGAITATACTALAVAGACVAMFGPQSSATVFENDTMRITAPQSRSIAFGCETIVEVTEPGTRIGYVEGDVDLPYIGTVPSTGWFSIDEPVDEKGSSPEQVMNSLWRGERAAWYSPDLTPAEVSALRAVVEANPQWRMSLWQWPADRADQFPRSSIAFASWGISQVCSTPDEGVVEYLLSKAGPAPGSDGREPTPAFPEEDDVPQD